jgi:hypothetical protein
VRPATSGALAAPTADVAIALGGTTLTNTARAANLVPGPRGINFEGTRYYISYGTATSPAADAGGTFFGQSTALCTLSSSGVPTALTNAPRGFIDIKGYQSRIWGLGGVDDPGSGTTFNPLTLFFTNPIGPGGGNTASFGDWKDPVANTTNKIVMDGDTTDPGVGLATVRNGLLILRYASVWLLKGSTTANYALVPVSRDTGCIDPRSIVEADQGVYFLGRQGLMLTNGVTTKNVSGSAERTLQTAIGMVVNSIKSSFGGYATCALTSDSQIVVSMGVPSITSGAPDGHIQPVWCGMFDPNLNAWTRITSALFASDGNITVPGNNYPGYVFNTPDRRLLSVGDKYVTQWESETTTTSLTSLSATNLPTAATNDAAVGHTAWSNPTNAELSDSVYATVSDGASVSAYAGAATSTGTGNVWSNLSGALGSSGSGATSTHGGGGSTVSQALNVSAYGFAVPAGATVTGILVGLNKGILVGGGDIDANVQLTKAGVATGSNKASGATWPSSASVVSYGSTGDLWGTTWTPSDINNSGFGVTISATMPINAEIEVLSVQITVYYALGSELLKATSYGFAVPSNATIVGIQVNVLRASSGASIVDTNIQLYKAGVLQAANRSAGGVWINTSWGPNSYGGPADLWGTTWTPADINNSGFGAGIAARASGTADTAFVDSVAITVYYTVAGVTKQQSFVKLPALYDTDAAGNSQPIPFLWRTKLLPVVGTASATRKVAQLKRWVADYIFQGTSLPSTNGFSVTLKDASGATITDGQAVDLPITNNSSVPSSISAGQPNAATSIQRFNHDIWTEIVDMCVEVAWTDVQRSTAPGFSAAEIYGVGIEFAKARELR